eukprot:Amastigsp_a678938_12.p3 type:complete len:173 gc:universal Amastigsp_a678938_12:1158-640(-)
MCSSSRWRAPSDGSSTPRSTTSPCFRVSRRATSRRPRLERRRTRLFWSRGTSCICRGASSTKPSRWATSTRSTSPCPHTRSTPTWTSCSQCSPQWWPRRARRIPRTPFAQGSRRRSTTSSEALAALQPTAGALTLRRLSPRVSTRCSRSRCRSTRQRTSSRSGSCTTRCRPR